MPRIPEWNPRTRLVHAGTQRSDFGELSEGLFLTQAYLYPSAEVAEARSSDNEAEGYVYSRFGNPTVSMFQDRLAAYEEAESACAFATGMAAVTAALLCSLKAGDHVVASRVLFGSCRWVVNELLPRFGIDATLVDGRSVDAWRDAMRGETRILFTETPANPNLELVDIEAVAAIAHDANALFIVDNALASPVCQRPLALGADVSVYSATKHIDGQGRCLGGAVLGSREFIDGPLLTLLRNTGGTLSPFNAWTFLKSLETLELRVQAQCATTTFLAERLDGHAEMVRCLHPGLPTHPQHTLAVRQMRHGGSLISLELKGGKAAAFQFLNALKIVKICNNLGDAKSLATHPATTTHGRLPAAVRAELDIPDGMVRISCGLEDPDDLLDDIRNALSAAGEQYR